MHRHPVNSSRISNVGWENNILEIGFPDGSVYQYFNVSESEYRNFINSPSLGSALNILQRFHRYSRIN